MTEQLADNALGAIARHRGAHLPRRRDAEARDARFPFSGEHRHEAARTLRSGLIDKLEVTAFAHVIVSRKREGLGDSRTRGLGHHELRPGGPQDPRTPGPGDINLLLVRHREALPAFGAPALQHLLAVLGRHAHTEAMTLGAAAGIGLKRSLALLGSGHFSPSAFAATPLRRDHAVARVSDKAEAGGRTNDYRGIRDLGSGIRIFAGGQADP